MFEAENLGPVSSIQIIDCFQASCETSDNWLVHTGNVCYAMFYIRCHGKHKKVWDTIFILNSSLGIKMQNNGYRSRGIYSNW